MKKLQIHSSGIAVFSAVLIPVFMLVDLWSPAGITLAGTAFNLLFATGVMLSVPPRCGSVRMESLTTIRAGVSYIVLKSVIVAVELSLGRQMLLAAPAAIGLVEIPVLLKFYGWRISKVMVLFKEWTPEAYFTDLTHVIMHAGYVLLALITGIAAVEDIWAAKIAVLLLSGTAFVWQVVSKVIRRRPMLRSSKIIKLQRRFSEWRKSEPRKRQSRTSQLHDIYVKAEEYMRVRKPFLAEGLTLEDMAERMYVNKNYLSRAINTYSGKRLRLWLNTHRVLYSIELFKKGEHLKISTLSSLCGFATPVTYTQAFQVVMGESPGSYFHRLRLEHPE